MAILGGLHILLFPFMSKGHTIPLLHLAKLIHSHRPHATFTVFTTPANHPFISCSLSTLSSSTSIVTLPFLLTSHNHGIPPGVESTDQLPSMSLFYSFANATEQLQPLFETELEKIQGGRNPVSFCICDGFLYWTQASASKFEIPRLGFYGMNIYVSAISWVMFVNKGFDGVECEDEWVQVPEFPWIKITKNHFDNGLKTKEMEGPASQFLMNCGIASSKSRGFVVNSFEELEKPFLEYLNSASDLKHYCVGPFCFAEKAKTEETAKQSWIRWLDEKKNQGKSVLYVAFGSQAEISNDQLKEIVMGLEKSDVDFLWALRIKPSQEEVMEGFEERVKGRGMVVRTWVEQRVILEHEIVQGFLSHCGWNSVTESICAGVPILAWPLMAEQHLNVNMVVDEIKIGLRIETRDGLARGFIKGEGLRKMVVELMHGEAGFVARTKVKEVREAARMAITEGGSSWLNLESLLNDLAQKHCPEPHQIK